MEHFNKLTPAEHERLSLLMEECGEVIQAIGKIFRHGYKSCHPVSGEYNRHLLETECGHIRHAMIRLCEAGDLKKDKIHHWANIKKVSVEQYLHHQG